MERGKPLTSPTALTERAGNDHRRAQVLGPSTAPMENRPVPAGGGSGFSFPPAPCDRDRRRLSNSCVGGSSLIRAWGDFDF
jgi:hypothetical protein